MYSGEAVELYVTFAYFKIWFNCHVFQNAVAEVNKGFNNFYAADFDFDSIKFLD